MEFLTALWAPILLSAVLVFVVSSIIHMVFKYHANDIRQVPNQDAVQAALRPFGIPPGDYCLPRESSMQAMKAPEYVEKLKKGPVMIMTVLPNGEFKMGKSMLLWFLYSIVISFFAGYLAWHAAPTGSPYLHVFRYVGCTAFMGYAMALPQACIWYGKSWSSTLLTMFDGLLYAMVTAGTFGWLWPKM